MIYILRESIKIGEILHWYFPYSFLLQKFNSSQRFHLFSNKTADIVSGGVWGRRPHTLSEPALLVS
jgi:hypothetical protein